MAAKEHTPENTHLERFILLAKTSKGKAAVALIQEVLRSQNVFVYGAFLASPNIQGTQHSSMASETVLFGFQAKHMKLLMSFVEECRRGPGS